MSSSSTFEARVDALYAAPLDAFVAERKRLAGELKREGATAEARGLLALAKPTLSAWLTNQTIRRAESLVPALAAATDAVAAAQRAAPGGTGAAPAFQSAVAEQRRLIAHLGEIARQVATELGTGGAVDAIDRVENNLRWGAIAGPDRDALLRGRLVRDVAAPGFGGFGEFESLEAPAGQPAPRSAPDTPKPSPERRAANADEHRDKEAARERARAAAEAEREHRRRLAAHEADLRKLQGEITRARRALEGVEADRREADRRVDAAEPALEAARAARDEAESRRHEAAETLATLERDEASLRKAGPDTPTPSSPPRLRSV